MRQLSEKRLKEIYEFSQGYPDYATFLASSRDPIELHLFADFYNWDGGTKPLIELVRNPACDLNTAKLIYWLAGPETYQIYPTLTELTTQDPEIWKLIDAIRSKYEAGEFGDATIPWYPREHGALEPDHEDAKWQTPDEFRQELPDPDRVDPPDPETSTYGEAPDFDATWDEIYEYFSKQEVVYTTMMFSKSKGKEVEPAPYTLIAGLQNRDDAESGLMAGLAHPSLVTAAYCAHGLFVLGGRWMFMRKSLSDRDGIVETLKNRTGTVRICQGPEERQRPIADAFAARKWY